MLLLFVLVTRPLLPVYAIALLVVAAGIVVVVVVLLVVMAFKKSAEHRKRKRAYFISAGTAFNNGCLNVGGLWVVIVGCCSL